MQERPSIRSDDPDAAPPAGPRRSGWRSAADWPIVSGVEALFFLAFLLTAIWIVQPISSRHMWPAFSLFMLCALASHLFHGETLADLGIRFDNLKESLAEAILVVVPALLLAFAIGRFMEGGRSINTGRLIMTFISVYPWALFQQYGLQCLFGRRLAPVFQHPTGHAVICAGIFAALHLPNPFLTAVTFGAGYCWCVLFRRRPNLFALGASHALASSVLYYSLPPSITHLMRVGPGYLTDLPF